MHKLCVVMNAVSCTHLIDMSNKTAKIITSTACYICTNIGTNKCKRELLQSVGHTINTRLKAGFPLATIFARSDFFPLSVTFRLKPGGTN